MDDPAVRSEYKRCRLDVRLALMLAGVAADDARCGFGIQAVEHPEFQPELLDHFSRFPFAIC
jgi:hypothetical protein